MKTYRKLLVMVLIGAVAVFSFFYYLGHNDTLKLDGFSDAYRDYDRAILEYSNAVIALSSAGTALPTEQERQVDQALYELKAKASARISSLTRNDAELMSLALEIAGLSSQELQAANARSTARAQRTLQRL